MGCAGVVGRKLVPAAVVSGALLAICWISVVKMAEHKIRNACKKLPQIDNRSKYIFYHIATGRHYLQLERAHGIWNHMHCMLNASEKIMTPLCS